MIGRGVLGDPWLIKECMEFLETGNIVSEASIEEKFLFARKHAQRLCSLKGEHVGIKEMRGHAAWYVKGLKNSHHLKQALSQMNTYDEFDKLLREYESMHVKRHLL